MRPVTMYQLNRYIETCGHFFLVRYLDSDPADEETCRIHLGTAGPASFELPPEKTAFLYLGDPLQPEKIEEGVSWNKSEDGVLQADAIAFLKEHRIPFRINRLYSHIKKAEKWLPAAEAVLGQKSLLDLRISENTARHNSGTYLSIDLYVSPGELRSEENPDSNVKSFHALKYISASLYEASEGLFLTTDIHQLEERMKKVFEEADQKNLCTLESLLQRLPVRISHPECRQETYGIFSEYRRENYVCINDLSGLEEGNVLPLSGYFHNCGRLYLAFSSTPFLQVPCRIRISGRQRELEIPWRTDPENTYLIYRDETADLYLFEHLPFVRGEDGSWCCSPQKVLQNHGIELKIETKAGCRKLLNHLEKDLCVISAAPCGYCYGGSRQAAWYTRCMSWSEQYLKDCRICGHQIRKIPAVHRDGFRNWLNEETNPLFRNNGDLSAAYLRKEGKHFLTIPHLCFETEDGTLELDCLPEKERGTGRETLRFLRENEVVWERDVTGWNWEEKAETLVKMLTGKE